MKWSLVRESMILLSSFFDGPNISYLFFSFKEEIFCPSYPEIA